MFGTSPSGAVESICVEGYFGTFKMYPMSW